MEYLKDILIVFGLVPTEIVPRVLVLGIGLMIFHYRVTRRMLIDLKIIRNCVENISYIETKIQESLDSFNAKRK